ncbi:MAG: hypothetical protein Q9214_008021, partial [Letrouitia sp. 1 TL-2023]
VSEKPRAQKYVLKTFKEQNVEEFKNEKEAFNRIRYGDRPPENIITYYGSFVRDNVYNIILEFADQGNLDSFMKENPPPSWVKDRIYFWQNLLDIGRALVTLHGYRDVEFKKFKMERYRGWHQDINPNNILVKSRSKHPVYSPEFKLADLGLSHFVDDAQADWDATDKDSYGTTSYAFKYDKA